MALPAGVQRLGSFKGTKGDTGSLAFATAETVSWTDGPEVEMVGPESARGAHFKIPLPLPGPETVNNDDATELLLKNPTKTQQAVVDLITPPVARDRSRTLRQRQRAAHSVARRRDLPATLGWDPGFTVLSDGVLWWVPQDVSSRRITSGKMLYVSTEHGTSGNPGTQVGSLTTAVEAGVAVTSLAITAATVGIVSGAKVAVVAGTDVVSFTTTANVSVGATSIAVASNAPGVRLPVGAVVAGARPECSGTVSTYAANGDTILLLDKFNFRNALSGTVFDKSLSVIGLHQGTICSVSDDLTWTVAAGYSHVWQAARTNVRNVIDIAVDPDGFEYTKVASVAACEALPGSWYQAADGSGLLSMHTMDGVVPDNRKQLALLTDEVFGIQAVADQTLFFGQMRIIGGKSGVSAQSTSSTPLQLVMQDVDLLWGGHGPLGAVAASLRNGLNILGNVSYYGQRVRVGHTALDGFNYHAYGGFIPNFIEIDCEGWACGVDSIPQAAGVAVTQNGSTAHDGVQGVRVGGFYHDTYGAPVADVQAGTRTVNFGLDVWGSWAPIESGFNSAFSAQQAGVEMWAYGCRFWGTNSDIYCVTGATMHIADLTEYDTKTGGGTFDIISAG